MWQFALITNLLVAVAYAGVTHHIGVHLTRTHQWRHNLLAATVAIFFASCSVNQLAHSVRLLLQPEWRSIWSWHMLTVDSLTALFGLWYFYERFRSPKMSRGAALFEDSTVRRRDAMEIQDNVAQGLIAARYALDRGDARAADSAVQAAIESARRVKQSCCPPEKCRNCDVRRESADLRRCRGAAPRAADRARREGLQRRRRGR